MTTPATMSKTAFAAHLSVGKSYISALGKSGRLVLTADGLVDVAASIERIQQTSGAPERAAAPLVPEKFGDIRDRLEKAKAEMAEIDLAERKGELVQAADVRAIVMGAATTLRGRLESWPDQIAPQLAAISEEGQVRSLLAGEIEQVLSELSHQFGKLMQGAA